MTTSGGTPFKETFFKRGSSTPPYVVARDDSKGKNGFTTIELLLVIAFFGLMAAIVSIPLSTLQTGTALRDAEIAVTDTLRRAETQAMSGLDGDSWGVHFSDSDGCALPAGKFHVFRGSSFTSATTTIDTIELPGNATVSAAAVGGGCDVKFSRFHGSATTTGTITIANPNNESRTITINQYGRVTSQ